MSDPFSRYANATPLVMEGPDGTPVRYLDRRVLRAYQAPVLARVTVQDGDRLDTLAARWLGNAEVWWRIADASHALHPADVVAEPGSVVVVPVPE